MNERLYLRAEVGVDVDQVTGETRPAGGAGIGVVLFKIGRYNVGLELGGTATIDGEWMVGLNLLLRPD